MRRNSFGGILFSALMIFPVVTPSLGATQRGVEAARKPDSSPYVWIDSLTEPAKISFLIRVEDGKKIATVEQNPDGLWNTFLEELSSHSSAGQYQTRDKAKQAVEREVEKNRSHDSRKGSSTVRSQPSSHEMQPIKFGQLCSRHPQTLG